jgi:MOSC domain-containing protein YiiM
LLFSGIKDDMHAGLTRKSDVRTIKQYARDTDIRNVRQLTLVSEEELAEIAGLMGIPEMKAAWLGANVVTSGIPDLTLLTPSTRLQFPSGATIVVDMENFPCRQVADVVTQYHPEPKAGLVASAMHKRGVTAWVEREGIINGGDDITLWLPPQRLYAHMGS